MFFLMLSHIKASQLLPRGWVYQRTVQRTLNFLNKEGVFLTTMEKALTYFSTCGEYSLEEVDRFRRFASHAMAMPRAQGHALWCTRLLPPGAAADYFMLLG